MESFTTLFYSMTNYLVRFRITYLDITFNSVMQQNDIKLNKTKVYHYIICINLILLIITVLFISDFKRTVLIPHQTDPIAQSINNDSLCSIRGDKWIVMTTISYPTPSVYKFLTLDTTWNLIVVADRNTPHDWLAHLSINTSRLLFLSLKQQYKLPFQILRHLSEGSYARKNLGYLVAIRCGAQIIFETDDDHLPETFDINLLPKVVQPKHVPWIAFHRQRSLFVNIYGSFGHPNIWPRGFPIAEFRNVSEDGWHSVRQNLENNTHAYIQQYLADLDLDADTISRLAYPVSAGQINFDRNQPPITLQPFTFSPYNTQSTVTYYEAFWGLYLPITTTSRLCDIWRSFWTQRLLWDIGGQLMFSTSTLKQVRNSHSYSTDMDDEYKVYNQSSSFVRFLASWSSRNGSLVGRMIELAKSIAENGFWQAKEIQIMDAWIADLRSVDYRFPPVVAPSPRSSVITRKRAAVCVTGIAECIQEGWTPTHTALREYFREDIDVFFFLSSLKEGPVPLNIRLQQARLYLDSTVTILYEDRIIDPQMPPNCSAEYYPNIDPSHMTAYYQQLWALAECFDLVKAYEQQMNIRYEFLIRARIDSIVLMLTQNVRLPKNMTILLPEEDHHNGYNDRFAIGLIDVMEKYMRRWYFLKACFIRHGHSEIFLKNVLNRFGINAQKEKILAYFAMPHGPLSCH